MARFSPQRWNEIDAAFQAALEKGSSERDAYLDGLREKDPELHREVEKLLAADSRSTDFFDARIPAEIETLAEDLPGSLAGRRVGAYELQEEIGAGGMGSVYLARRADDEYRQRVTVKVIKPGMDSREFLRRFLNERQILAGLEHPNVARMLDGGTTDRGLPYFVMEYIEGEPIDRYCDHHGLPVEKRLELFRKVCSAVQAAHRVPVVHRDIKPANILVTAEGEPKLLDFGVAKLLDPERAGATFNPTLVDQMRLMTPAYASPEQLRGDPVTTASDIYSLGMLLYELLTGRKPYDLSNLSRQEVERVVCEEEPVKPSTVVVRSVERAAGGEGGEEIPAQVLSALRGATPEALRRKLSGDLDNVVLMALRKDPQRRYLTAEQMAEDVRRHLEDRPVVARPRTLRYRTRKFVRRNKLLVAFVVSLMALAVGMTWQSIRVARERDRVLEAQNRTERERQAALQVADFLSGLFEESNPFGVVSGEGADTELTAHDLLDRGVRRLADRLGRQPEIRARLLNTIGAAYIGLSNTDVARKLIEEGLELRRQLWGEEHLQVAESLQDLAYLNFVIGQYELAEELYLRAIEIRRRTVGERTLEVAESLHGLAEVRRIQGEFEEAERLYREALSLRRELSGEESFEFAETLSRLGLTLQTTGRLQEAEALHRRVLTIRKRLFGEGTLYVAGTYNDLAVVLYSMGEYPEAARLYRDALDIIRNIMGEENSTVAVFQNNLGWLVQSQGKFEEAEELYRNSLRLRLQLYGDEHPSVARSRNNLAGLLVATGRPEEAEVLARQALPIFETTYPAGHWRIAYGETTLAACWTGLGDFDRAEPLLQEGFRILEKEVGVRSLYTQQVLERLVALYEAWGKSDEAAEYRSLLTGAEAVP